MLRTRLALVLVVAAGDLDPSFGGLAVTGRVDAVDIVKLASHCARSLCLLLIVRL